MMRYTLIALLTMLVSCKKSISNIDNLSQGRIYVIGHAGSGAASVNNPYPPDSWEAETRAVEYYGADGIETDLQLSRDSVLFMFHDATLESSSSCAGCISYMTSGRLAQCSFKPVAATVDMETQYLSPFEPLVSRFAARKVMPIMFIDLHGGSGCMMSESQLHLYYYRVMAEINKIEIRYNAYDRIFVQCNDEDWTRHAHKRFPKINILFDAGDELLPAQIDSAHANGFYGIAAKNMAVTQSLSKKAHDYGLYVQIYGANAGSDIVDAINKSPDYILADNIQLVQSILQ